MRIALPCFSLVLIISCNAKDTAVTQDLPKKQTWEQSRARATDYRMKADICLHFENWNTIHIYGEPATTGKLTTVKLEEVRNLDETLGSFKGAKKLAVVEISHRFHTHYSGDNRSRELGKLEQKIKSHGFAKVVFLSETAVGFGILRE